MSGGPECKFEIIARRKKAKARRRKTRHSETGAFSDFNSYGTKLQDSKTWSKGPPR